MAHHPSLSRRIIVRLALITVCATSIAYGWLYLKARGTAASLRDHTLTAQARIVAGYISVGPDGVPRLHLPTRMMDAYDAADSRYRYAVRSPSGQILFASGAEIGSALRPSPGHDQTYDYDPDGPGPLHVFGAAVTTQTAGRTFLTQVEQIGSDQDYITQATTAEFLTDGIWLGAPFMLSMLAIGVLTVRSSLRPVQRLSGMAAEIGPGRTDLRLPVTDVPIEVSPLVEAFNAVLDRLDEGLRQQQEFTADAAHQLRTPLAVLGAHIDTLGDPNVSARLREDLDSMTRIVTQLLVASRIEAMAGGLEDEIDLTRVAERVVERFAPIALSAGKSMTLEAEGPVLVRGNEWVLVNAIDNLVENALSHTPPGRAVRIRVVDDPSLQVIDAGPGVPKEMREEIFKRFWRGDRSRSGAGLGLSIVRRIMEALHGSVVVTDEDSGGAVFALRFPRIAAVDGARAAPARFVGSGKGAVS